MDARLAVLGAVFWAASALPQGFDHSHGVWDALLKRHVVVSANGSSSLVSYAGMSRERAALSAYLDALSSVKNGEYSAWRREQQMAFLINAYNAFTVEKILKRYPDIRSIREFGRFFGNPFRDEFFELLERKASLDWIEHDNLRAGFGDPRVHYAVNCASLGCPMLREEAYVGDRLDSQLQEQAIRFLADRTRNRFADGKLQVSRIFDWFKEDFEPRAAYFARHAGVLADDAASRQLIARGKVRLGFLDYDWSLNDAGR
jgi:hypothetical protein